MQFSHIICNINESFGWMVNAPERNRNEWMESRGEMKKKHAHTQWLKGEEERKTTRKMDRKRTLYFTRYIRTCNALSYWFRDETWLIRCVLMKIGDLYGEFQFMSSRSITICHCVCVCVYAPQPNAVTERNGVLRTSKKLEANETMSKHTMVENEWYRKRQKQQVKMARRGKKGPPTNIRENSFHIILPIE